MKVGMTSLFGGWNPPWRPPMLWTIALVLLALWLIGVVTTTTLGGWIHLLVVVAAIVLVIRLLQGRRITA